MSYLPASKFGTCTQCGTDNTACVKIGKTLICLYCNKQNKAKQQVEKAKDKAKVQRAMSELKNLPDNKEAAVRNVSSLDAWFKKAAEVIAANPHCWNCGEFIPEKYYRHAIAHIFPKAHFESVKTHPLNYLVLGAGCGCHDKSHRLDTFSDMKVWVMAINRFKEFQTSILEKHKYLDLFIKYVEETI